MLGAVEVKEQRGAGAEGFERDRCRGPALPLQLLGCWLNQERWLSQVTAALPVTTCWATCPPAPNSPPTATCVAINLPIHACACLLANWLLVCFPAHPLFPVSPFFRRFTTAFYNHFHS